MPQRRPSSRKLSTMCGHTWCGVVRCCSGARTCLRRQPATLRCATQANSMVVHQAGKERGLIHCAVKRMRLQYIALPQGMRTSHHEYPQRRQKLAKGAHAGGTFLPWRAAAPAAAATQQMWRCLRQAQRDASYSVFTGDEPLHHVRMMGAAEHRRRGASCCPAESQQ